MDVLHVLVLISSKDSRNTAEWVLNIPVNVGITV